MSVNKSKESSLTDKINNLITAVPVNICSDDDDEVTRAKVVGTSEESNIEEFGHSSVIRKQNIDLLDEIDVRYKGKKVSRQDLYGDESNEEFATSSTDEEHSDDSGEKDSDEKSESNEEEDEINEVNSEDGEESSDDEDESGVDEDNPLRINRHPDDNFKSMNATNLRSDIEKGHCVREQLKLWEYLLEMRIQLQKCLVTSNELPQFDVHEKFELDKQFGKSKSQARNKLTDLLENLLQIQEALLKNNRETRNLLLKRNEKDDEGDEKFKPDNLTDEEIPSGTEDEDQEENECNQFSEERLQEPPKKKRKTLGEFERIIRERHENFNAYRDSVIQKWNDKTRLAAGNATKGISQSVVKQIEFVLNDKSKMVKRTQLKRSEYKIIGKQLVDETNEDGRRIHEYDPEIYDDDDFYHQLLRELIEQKSADITDPIQMSKQWIQLQNMRNKMKRKIDTRATKGRKIRYNVHTKLVNYMAPITVHDTWSDLAKNELYNSLFGKIKSIDASQIRSNQSL